MDRQSHKKRPNNMARRLFRHPGYLHTDFGGGQIWRMLALIALFFITAPVATTAMARAAYRTDSHDHEDLGHDDMNNPRYEQVDETFHGEQAPVIDS